METIRIPNRATATPVALSDILLAAPLASRLLFRSALPGNLVGMAAFGAYAGSALRDWSSRRGIRPVDFRLRFGVDPMAPPPMPEEARRAEIDSLIVRLNRLYTSPKWSRRRRAEAVDHHLTELIASHTGQRVLTSVRVRSFMMARLIFPFAVGACDVFSGDVGIFRDVGIFEPHVLAHEFCHRKGYVREVEAQVLAYLALSTSESAELAQSALAERLYRQLSLAAEGDPTRYGEIVEASGLRDELKSALGTRLAAPSSYERMVNPSMRRLYEMRMRMTGQNGLSDYDQGFTDVLHAIERGGTTGTDS